MLFNELYFETSSTCGFLPQVKIYWKKEIVFRSSWFLWSAATEPLASKCFIVEGLKITKYGEKSKWFMLF